jgi:pimeloyl-ACP methyl ester carboxylesterase
MSRRDRSSGAKSRPGSRLVQVPGGTLVESMEENSPALYRAGAGEPLLLLHGFTGTWHHWQPLIAELTRSFEVIAPTLAGHDGGKPYPAGSPMTFQGSTDSLESHLDELGVGTAHVVGNSMGGALALELAKRGRARSVVALAPAGGWTEGDGEARRLARFFARQLLFTRATASGLPSLLSRPRARQMVMRDVMRHGELLSTAEAVGLAEASLRCTVADRAIAALRTDRGLTLTELDRITCPVLLASPEFDRILPIERHAPRLLREIPGVEALILPGCGHVPMWDDTRLVVQTIREFVECNLPAAVPVDGSPTVAPARS